MERDFQFYKENALEPMGNCIRDLTSDNKIESEYATGIIQNVSAVTRNEKAKDMLSNSAFTIMLSQSETDANELSAIYNISKEEQRFIRQKAPGKGLLHLGATTIVPFDNIIPKNTKIYNLMTTKADEVFDNEQT